MRFLLPAAGSSGGPRPARGLFVLAAFGGGGLLALLVHAEPATSVASAAAAPSALSLDKAGVVPALGAEPTPAPLALPELADAVVEVEPAGPASGERTLLGEDEAAVHLARAWVAVTGALPSPEALSVVWAQWAHETGRGRRMRGYNFAGIKGNGPEGDSFVAWTREHAPKPDQRLRETFRAYSTPEGGAHDYVRLLSSRYPAAFRAAGRGDVVRFVRALDVGGYFTDSDRAYSRALSSLTRECLERAVARRAVEVVTRGALVPAREPTAL